MLNSKLLDPTEQLPTKDYFTCTDIPESPSIPKQEGPKAETLDPDSAVEPQSRLTICSPSLPYPPEESSPNDYLCAETHLDYTPDYTSKGFFKIPRSLRDHPVYASAHVIHRQILHTIIEHAAWKPRKFDDHGTIIDIAPGEFCISLRELAELCGPGCNKNWVAGALKKFSRASFGLTSILRQQVRQQRIVITITHQETYDQIFYSGQTASQTAVRQPEDRKEKDKQINQESSPVQSLVVELTDQQLKVVERLVKEHSIEVEAAGYAASEYSEEEIIGALKQRKYSKTKVYHQTHWLLATLKKKREKLSEYKEKVRHQEPSHD